MTDPYGSPQPQPWGTPANQPPRPAAPQPGYPGPTSPGQYPPAQQYPSAYPAQQPPPGYPAQQYPQAGYGYAPAGYQPAAPAQRSAILGIIALALTALATIGSVVAAIPVGELFAQIVAYAGTTDIGPEDVPPALIEQANGPLAALTTLAGLGFVGWIMGIVAAVTRRGRTWGVLAIVLGIAAPFIILFTMAGAMMPVLDSIR